MANSVFYSFDQKISTLSHAIVILGFRAVQSMAIAASSRSLFVKTHESSPWVWMDSPLAADEDTTRQICVYSKDSGELYRERIA